MPRHEHLNIRPALDASSHLDSLETCELCGGLEATTLQQCSACGTLSRARDRSGRRRRPQGPLPWPRLCRALAGPRSSHPLRQVRARQPGQTLRQQLCESGERTLAGPRRTSRLASAMRVRRYAVAQVAGSSPAVGATSTIVRDIVCLPLKRATEQCHIPPLDIYWTSLRWWHGTWGCCQGTH